jgi:H+-transporting ATPase
MVLVFLSLTLCSIAFWYLMAHDQVDFIKALSFTVVLMVASIPLAIEIVCTTTLALGSRQMAVYGAIVSRLSAIEDLAGLNILCSDKTGTLTLNKMEIQKECPTFIPGEDQRSILRYAAMAAKWREPPRDALDTLVLKSADLNSLDDVEQLKYVPFDPTFKRTEGTVREKNGKEFKVTKGAPDIIMVIIMNLDV